MGLNCKPGQMAWIRVPSTIFTEALGLTQLNGRVVQTLMLHPGVPLESPLWLVQPQQTVRIPMNATFSNGCLKAGDLMVLKGVPDAYLRPFDDLPPETLRETQRELVS